MIALLLLLLPAQDPSPAQVAEWIRALSSDEVAVREAATAALEKLGEKALPALRDAREKNRDAEVRARLDQAIAALEVRYPGSFKVVFTRGEEHAGELHLWEDGKETRLTENLTMESGARWSPDGTRLAYFATPSPVSESKAHRITVLDVASRKETPLGIGRSPVWSPDGRRIAYARKNELWITDLEGKEERVARQGQEYLSRPAWSADGKRIAFEADDAFHVVDLESRTSSLLSKLPENTKDLYSFSLSPDGTRVAFVAGNGPYWWHAFTMKADGSGLTRLTNDTFRFGILAWSPDGARLAASLEEEKGSALWVLDPRSGARTKAAEKSDPLLLPRWSADGRLLIYTTQASEIWLAHAGGQARRKLTTMQECWGPDGMSFAPDAWWTPIVPRREY